MFHNKTVDATLKILKEYACEYVVEWFGQNARFYKKGGQLYADIKANEQAIIYWCLQYGETIELVSPKQTRENIIKSLKTILNVYSKKQK